MKSLALAIAVCASLTVPFAANAQRTPPKPFGAFHHETAEYDPVNAYLTMLAVYKGYWDVLGAESKSEYQLKARSYFIQGGFPRVNFLEAPAVGTQCLVLSNARMVMVACRGSETYRGTIARPVTGRKMPRVAAAEAIRDWIVSDANFVQVPGGRRFGGSKVTLHRGFLTAAEGVSDALQEDLRKRAVGAGPGSDKPIFVAGHSLGAAVATLLAFNLKKDGFPVRALYAHASPMVAAGPVFGAEAARLGLRSYRTVNHRDLVTELPGATTAPVSATPGARRLAPLPYMHINAPLYYIDSQGEIRKNPSRDYVARDRKGPLTPRDHSGLIYATRLYSDIASADRVGLSLP